MPAESESFARIVGEFVRDFRREHRVTKDQLAREGRLFGMTWGTASISNIESGRAALTIPVLLALVYSMRRTGRTSTTLHDIIPSTAQFEVSSSLAISGAELKSFLSGDTNALAPQPIGFGMSSLIEELTAGTPARYSLSETRAAKKLGISPADLRSLAFDLWGQSLDQVVSESSGPDSSPQSRGHETRVYVEQLRRAIDKPEPKRTQGSNDG